MIFGNQKEIARVVGRHGEIYGNGAHDAVLDVRDDELGDGRDNRISVHNRVLN